MVDVVSTALAGHPSATALVDRDDRLTYGELHDRVRRTASGLRSSGLADGSLVAVAAVPSIDGVVAFFGVQAAGLIPVMVNPRSPVAEMARRFDELDPALVILGSDARPELPDGIRVVRPAGSSAGDAEVAAGDPVGEVDFDPDDPAVVLYTSGMAGLPQPVVLTYRNVRSTRDGLIAAAGAGLDPSTVAFAALPMAHVF